MAKWSFTGAPKGGKAWAKKLMAEVGMVWPPCKCRNPETGGASKKMSFKDGRKWFTMCVQCLVRAPKEIYEAMEVW